MLPGLNYCNVDLHVHTPASTCFTEEDVSPEDIVQSALDVGLDAIAITDHNSAEWVDYVITAGTNMGLIVFPGVEITVQPGVHVLAIFPENRRGSHVTDLLAELGLHTDTRGDSEALVNKYSVSEVLKMIRGHKALPIMAHIDDHKGAWHELRNSGQTLIQLWNSSEYAAVEIVNDNLPEEIGIEPYNYQPAYYWSSDNPNPDDPSKHSHLGIGHRYSRFKLEQPITWEGLRLCFQDPEVRIRPGNAITTTTHSVIQHVQIEGGFLDGFSIDLNPNLNCVIGGRGTGKSTLLEIIRYAFDIEPKTGTNVLQASGILDNVFPAGSRVILDFCLSDGSTYRIERYSGEESQLFRDDNGSFTPIDVAPGVLVPLQVYGQKEIYEISQDPTFQLGLLDNYLAEVLEPLTIEEQEYLHKIHENANAIKQLKMEIEGEEEELDSLGSINEELHRMEQQDFVSRVEQKQLFDQEQHILEGAETQIDDLVQALTEFLDANRLNFDSLSEEALDRLPNCSLLEEHRSFLENIDTQLENRLTSLITAINEEWQKGAAGRARRQESYESINLDYQNLLLEFQEAQQSLQPDRFIHLKNRKRELEELRTSVDRKIDDMNSLWNQRLDLLNFLRENRHHQYEIRIEKADELSGLTQGNVRITIVPAGNREVYYDYLTNIFSGLNVRTTYRQTISNTEADQPERVGQRPVDYRGETRYLVPRIPRYRDTIDLAEAIRFEQNLEADNESQLESQFGINSEAFRQNLSKLSEENLFDLEEFNVPDLPIIELRVARGELGYKTLDSLSIGQKCTALLSLVLLENPATLLVDQPEDDLDNQFIFDQIVATLRREKERRQFLIATHNANIPVSGDAELIIVLDADERSGRVADVGIGSIDNDSIKQYVERILEGGETAFRIRKEKYGIS